MTGRRAAHQADQWDQSRQLGQSHQIARASAQCGLGHPVTGPLQHHDQRDALLAGQLAQSVALVGRTAPDRPTEHGHVLGPGQRRAPVDPPGPGHQRVSRRGEVVGGTDQEADLDEGAGVEEDLQALAGVEASPLVLPGAPGLAAHGQRVGFAPRDLLEGRAPPVQLVLHAHPSRPCPAVIGWAHV